jgi:DeoR family transcriptional regulator, deoxyribose operon repressor
MPTQKRRDRISQILEILQLTRGATIRELSRRLDVSEMTIRRDLEVLSNDRKVRLVHAGAIPAEGLSEEGLFLRAPALEDSPSAEERMRIGRKAASLVEPGDIVIIDSGSTTEWLARAIPADLPVTILCFALNILVAAGQGASRTVVFAGGSLHHDTLVFESPEGVSLVRRYRANKAFLSAGGVDAGLGLTCANPAEAELKKAAVASSQTRILLTDSRKFGTVKPAWFADLKDLDAIITDQGVSLEYVEILRELGIALHVV